MELSSVGVREISDEGEEGEDETKQRKSILYERHRILAVVISWWKADEQRKKTFSVVFLCSQPEIHLSISCDVFAEIKFPFIVSFFGEDVETFNPRKNSPPQLENMTMWNWNYQLTRISSIFHFISSLLIHLALIIRSIETTNSHNLELFVQNDLSDFSCN